LKFIDLHVHSTFSDGSFSPAGLVEMAGEAKLSAFALTDHDTTEGFEELLAVADKYNDNKSEEEKIEVLPGVEISAAYKERDIHILGLLIDHKNRVLTDMLAASKKEREDRNKKMVKNLQDAGLDITLKGVMAGNGDAVITRAHFAKYLVEHHLVRTYQDAFEFYLGDKTPYYVPRKFTSPRDAIESILAAGGVPVLAHPCIYHLAEEELLSLIDRLIGYGLRGIETLYSTNTPKEEKFTREIAEKKGLLITGGSDFHGAPKPSIRLGKGKGNLAIPYEILDRLREEQAKIKGA